MTFKEQLTYDANKYELTPNIQEEVDNIKRKMTEAFKERKFDIVLIQAKGCMAIGVYVTNRYSLFIPERVAPLHYRQLFVEEFKQLGFTDNDIEFSNYDCDLYESWIITLKW